MIIDAPRHFWKKEWLQAGMRRLIDQVIDELGVRDRDTIYGGSPGRLIADLDRDGIDKAAILGLSA